MSHGLIVTDSYILKDLYNLNFKAYVDLSCTVKSNLEDTLSLLEQGIHLDLIVAQTEIDGEDVASSIYNYIIARDLEDIPIITIGEDPALKNKSNVYSIDSKFNIKELLQLTAKILKISAKDMAEKNVPEYYPIPVSSLSHVDIVETSIFYLDKETDKYFSVIDEGTSPTAKIHNYIEEGITNLYIDSSKRLFFANFISKNIISVLKSENISSSERVEIANIGYEFIAQYIDDIESIDDLLEISAQCVNSVSLIIEEHPKLNSLLQNLFLNKTSYPFKHCQLNAFISSFIIERLDWGTKEHAEKMAFISFYHDILLSKKEYIIIDNNKDLENAELNDAEKELIKNHAYRTSILVQQLSRSPIGVDTIIKQHHGMLSGIGFEKKRFSNNLSPLTIIFIIAEAFGNAILMSEEVKNGICNYDNFDINDVLSNLYIKFPNSNYTRAIRTLEEFNF